MSKEETQHLLKFLQSFSEDTIDIVTWLRSFIWDMYPQANELAYDNYNAVALSWSLTERLMHVFCSVAVYRSNENIHFGFYWGNEIADPENILLGEGNQYRYILVKDKKSFPKGYIKKLIKESYANSLGKLKDDRQIVHGKTIIKSVSDKKRTRRKAVKS